MPEQRTAKSPVWLKRLGGRIRQARRIRGFTQTDIARPNLTKSFISLLESGRTYPSVSTLVTLASRLQSSLALLLLETPQLPRETALNLLELARASAPANAAKTDRLLAAVEALSEDANDLRAELLLTRRDIAVVQGRPRDAERAFSDALAWSRKNELRPFEPRALSRMAHLAFARHEEDAGRERLENALAQFRSTRTLRSAEGCKALLTYGELMSRQSRTARAQRILLEVAQAAQRQDLTLILGRAQLGLARIHRAAGRAPAAVTALRKAKDAFAKLTIRWTWPPDCAHWAGCCTKRASSLMRTKCCSGRSRSRIASGISAAKPRRWTNSPGCWSAWGNSRRRSARPRQLWRWPKSTATWSRRRGAW